MSEVIVVPVPRLGESVLEVTIVEWLCQPGDVLKNGSPIALVSTEKVDVEINADVDGTVVELLAEVGDSVDVGDPVLSLQPLGAV